MSTLKIVIVTFFVLSLSLCSSLFATEYSIIPALVQGVSQGNIDEFCSDMEASNISCHMSLFKLTPPVGMGLSVTSAEAHLLTNIFVPVGETTIRNYNANQLYSLLVQLAISYGGDNMLLHMRTLKRIFAPIAANELEDWQAFIVRRKTDPENKPAAFYFFINPQNERCVYVALKK